VSYYLPAWWPTAGLNAKAEWLVRTGQAKTFSEACSILSKLRRRKPRPPVNVRLPYADN
jgi:hypothetical protein